MVALGESSQIYRGVFADFLNTLSLITIPKIVADLLLCPLRHYIFITDLKTTLNKFLVSGTFKVAILDLLWKSEEIKALPNK